MSQTDVSVRAFQLASQFMINTLLIVTVGAPDRNEIRTRCIQLAESLNIGGPDRREINQNPQCPDWQLLILPTRNVSPENERFHDMSDKRQNKNNLINSTQKLTDTPGQNATKIAKQNHFAVFGKESLLSSVICWQLGGLFLQ